MAFSIKRGSDAYLSRKSAMQSRINPPEISASLFSGSAPSVPEAASISCCIIQETIRFSEPPASAANAATVKFATFPR